MNIIKIYKVAKYYQEKLAKKKGKKWKKLPKGWDTKSRKKYYQSLVGDTEHPVTKCMDKMKGKMDDPGAFCAALKDREEGKDWRKGKNKKKKKASASEEASNE